MKKRIEKEGKELKKVKSIINKKKSRKKEIYWIKRRLERKKEKELKIEGEKEVQEKKEGPKKGKEAKTKNMTIK